MGQTEEKEIEQQNLSEIEKNYIEKIKELRDNTVSKEQYVKVLEENKKLLDAFTENSFESKQDQEENKVDTKGILNDLMTNDNLTNLAYIEKVLQYRKAVMDEGKTDPFLPQGVQISATDDDVKAAEEVANLLEHCVEVSEGNSDIFTRELQLHLIDTPRPKK